MPEIIIINDMNLFKNEIEIVLCEENQKEVLTEIKTSDQSENSIHTIVNNIENIFINSILRGAGETFPHHVYFLR